MRTFYTFTVGHSIQQELETDRRAVAFFGKQAYRTNHVAANTVTSNCETCGIDVELIGVFRDVFRDFVGFLERDRVSTLQRPMVLDEYYDHAGTGRDVPDETSVRIECTQDPVCSVEVHHDRQSDSNPKGTDYEDTGRAQGANLYHSLFDVCLWHRNHTSRYAAADIPRCIWCHCENGRAATDRDVVEEVQHRRVYSDRAFRAPAFDLALVLNHGASPEVGCYCWPKSNLRPPNRPPLPQTTGLYPGTAALQPGHNQAAPAGTDAAHPAEREFQYHHSRN